MESQAFNSTKYVVAIFSNFKKLPLDEPQLKTITMGEPALRNLSGFKKFNDF